ncbi:hypothetical protein CYMTET_48035 [Cymbomonas tetramitiformis]|uniref:H15 domain-containing protein n=1 Tax=Cymbomonas tetramitiformis TaxID=36881 RepID=A0AAE0BUY7_9CHLO|nr:hypothetical protein CYMTET_48035 [Cymbomonas tetramitiformis]
MPPKAATKPKAAPAHPKYDVMVKAAIVALKERTGSSVPAITKYLGANYTLPDNYKKTLSTQLKKLVASGKLVKVKASYKLSDEFKKPEPKKKAAAPKKKKEEEGQEEGCSQEGCCPQEIRRSQEGCCSQEEGCSQEGCCSQEGRCP